MNLNELLDVIMNILSRLYNNFVIAIIILLIGFPLKQVSLVLYLHIDYIHD